MKRVNKHTDEYYTRKYNESVANLVSWENDEMSRIALGSEYWREYGRLEAKIEIIQYEAKAYNGLILGA